MNKRPAMIKPRIAEAAARAHPDWDVLPGGRLERKKGKARSLVRGELS